MNRLFKTSVATLLAAQTTICADNGYDSDFINLVEIVYGDGYLSQGGSEVVEQMFEGVELKGKRVLDLGCGIGGPALHLIKNHPVTVVGVDPEPLMIHKSSHALQQLRSDTIHPIKGSAYFVTMENPLNLKQFPDSCFDIVTSREAILHVPNEHKLNYYREIFRVLKKGGKLVIIDWQHRSPNYSDAVRTMMEMDGVPFHLTTPEEYHQIVEKAGFSNVLVKDMTMVSVDQTQHDLDTIKTNRNQIINKFGKETFDYALNSWNIQGQAFKDRELLVGLITARKD